MFLPFVKGGAKRLRGFLQLLEGNFRAADAVGTVHDMRFVFVDNDTKLLFATAYDGDFDPYIDDFAAKIPNAMDLWLCNCEGYPGMRSGEGEGVDRQPPDRGRGLVRQQSEPDRGGDATARKGRQGRRRTTRQDRLAAAAKSSERMDGHVVRDGSRRQHVSDLTRRRSTWMRSRRSSSGRGRHRTSARTCSCTSTMLQAGREFLRRLTPHIGSVRALVECGQYLAGGRDQLYGPRSARASRRTRCKASPKHSASAWRPAPGSSGDEGVNDPKNWEAPFGTGQVHIGVSAFSDSEEKWRRALAVAREQYEALLGRQRSGDAELRLSARRPQSPGLQGRHRPAGDRGQRRRAAAGPGAADQGRRVHPGISG